MGLFEAENMGEKVRGKMWDEFGAPPFSVLNTIREEWQKRKHYWTDEVGIESTEGRDTKWYNATPANIYNTRGAENVAPQSISTFDPVLAELMIKWFSHEGDTILDPFAGGSVRGIVAGCLARNYIGVDLSSEQVSANNLQVARVSSYIDANSYIDYYCADSLNILGVVPNISYGMLFTCPPYYNLERYTDDPRDLSKMSTYQNFIYKYRQILERSVSLLMNNSFIVIVVSEIRDPHGRLYGLVPDTMNIFREMPNVTYYNEAILYNNPGSLPLRAGKYFKQSRKLGRTHQNVLIFWKGKPEEVEKEWENSL